MRNLFSGKKKYIVLLLTLVFVLSIGSVALADDICFFIHSDYNSDGVTVDLDNNILYFDWDGVERTLDNFYYPEGTDSFLLIGSPSNAYHEIYCIFYSYSDYLNDDFYIDIYNSDAGGYSCDYSYPGLDTSNCRILFCGNFTHAYTLSNQVSSGYNYNGTLGKYTSVVDNNGNVYYGLDIGKNSELFFSSHPLKLGRYSEASGYFFYSTPLVPLKLSSQLQNPIVTTSLGGALTEVLSVLPLVLLAVVSYLGLRKALSFVLTQLNQS